MEFGKHESRVQEEMIVQVPPQPALSPEHDSLEKLTTETKTSVAAEKGAISAAPIQRDGSNVEVIRYRECQKNHAISIGGYAVDGCGEFMGAGEEGTLEADICGACNCHRNFHRKEVDGIIGISSYHHQPWPQPHPPLQQHHKQFFSYYQLVPPPPPGAGYHHLVETPPVSQHRPLALPAASGGVYKHEEDDMFNPKSRGAGRAKKRFRTKFTQEQKDKMLTFVEKLGWRIQKHDAAAVEQFCDEIGVKGQVLKVWMHNNKHTLSKKA